MKLSLHWLSEYVTFSVTDPEEIARRLTAHVGEVDEVAVQGKYLQHCCVGKVVTVGKHPNADKLLLCDVETDRGLKRVVCGGTNLREGMLVAFAHIGAKVKWHGSAEQTLEPVKIRGEKSEGMICAAEELELESMFPPKKEEGERPVVELKVESACLSGRQGKWKVGAPLREVLGMDDVVFHIDNHAITHRADLFSHIGFARECVAMGIAEWKPFDSAQGKPIDSARGRKPEFKIPKFPKTALPFKFIVEEKKLMPRYCACVIEVDSVGETPEWMKKRLLAVGWRPISLPVDITNYVASEVGVPLHSFDLDDLQGDVHMRAARKGERIVTLDQKDRELSEGAPILSDDIGVFDLLGIMGGLRSSTKATTRRIYLHSASIDPVAIRSAVIAMGHRTDAATVYEKGVPHIVTEQGFLRALQLFLELAPGAKIASALESKGDNGTAKPIAFSAAEAEAKLGVHVPEKVIVKMLEDLGCTVKKEKKGQKGRRAEGQKGQKGSREADDLLIVTPPLWRLKDLRGTHDLVEEVGRIYGFDKIPVTMPEGSITPPERGHRIHRLRDELAALGYMELQPLSLIGPDLVKKCNLDPERCVHVGNPIGEEVSLLQPCVMPQLLEHASRNMLLVDHALQTFHWGNIFTPGGQVLALGALLSSRIETTPSTEPFLRLKRDIVTALHHMGYAAAMEPTKGQRNAVAHPGRSASIIVAGTEVGSLFEVLPAVRERFDFAHRTAAVTLNLDLLLTISTIQRHARNVSPFPAIAYDVTMTLDRKKALQTILQKIRTSSPLLESVDVVDVYSGKPLEKDQYNVTVRCTYRSLERTLTEEEVKGEHAKIEGAVSK